MKQNNDRMIESVIMSNLQKFRRILFNVRNVFIPSNRIPALIVFLFFCCSTYTNAQLSPPSQSYALRFQGAEMAFTNGTAALQLGNTFTMETWVYFETITPYAFIMGKPHQSRHTDPYMTYCLELNADGRIEVAQSTGLPGSYRTATSNSQPELRKWIHVAASLSSGTLKLFINGIQVANTASAGSPSSSVTVPFTLGAGAGPDTSIQASGFVGSLRQARVWSTALSATEIQSIAVKHLTGAESGLLACWPLDDGTGSSAQSLGTNGLSMTLGDRTGQAKPSWIRTNYLDSLGIFTQAIEFPFPIIINSPQDPIPFDYDGDGDLDIILTGLLWPPTNPGTVTSFWFLRNDGAGNFSRDTSSWTHGLGLIHPRHWQKGDFNNDGFTDLIIVGHGTDIDPFPGENSLLLLRKSDGTMASIAGSLPTVIAFTHNVASADIDKDGDLDIYMCNIGGGTSGPLIYSNNGNGIFTSTAAGIPSQIAIRAERYTASIFADIDHDGDADLILGGHDGADAWTLTDKLLLNNGSGTFSPALANAMPVRLLGNTAGSVGLTSADVNNDGWIDIISSVHADYRNPTIQLLLNNGNGTFRDASTNISQHWPLGKTYGSSWIRWVHPADMNKDGWIDLVAVGQNECPSAIFLNMGNGVFKDFSEYYFNRSSIATLAVGDFTGDGMQDILAVRSNQTAVVFKTVSSPVVTSIEKENLNLKQPSDTQLLNNYPNPFNPTTTISYQLSTLSDVSLKVFDILGREIAILVNEQQQAGKYSVRWDASGATSGIYFYRLQAGTYSTTQRMILMK